MSEIYQRHSTRGVPTPIILNGKTLEVIVDGLSDKLNEARKAIRESNINYFDELLRNL